MSEFRLRYTNAEFVPPMGGAEPFLRTFIQEGLRSNRNFGWELALQVIFFRWDLKTPYIKNSEYESQDLKQKKNDSDRNFYNSSFFVPYHNNLLVVHICILIFHGVYSPLTTKIFLQGEGGYFFVPCSYELGRFQICWGPSVLGGPNFLFGRWGYAMFFHKATNDQSCKLKNS